MSTETTDTPDVKPPRGWILYDGSCGLCAGGARRWRRLVERRGFGLAPLQADRVAPRLGLPPDELLHEMRLITPGGHVRGGVEALVELARAVWWAWPFYLLAHVPGVRPLLRRVYRWIANHRHALSGACALPVSKETWADRRHS